jgi:hypothetical protein
MISVMTGLKNSAMVSLPSFAGEFVDQLVEFCG